MYLHQKVLCILSSMFGFVTSPFYPPVCAMNDIQDDYQGKISVSESGLTCLPWKVGSPFYGQENYCRNSATDNWREAKAWCFVAEEKREKCSVPQCKYSEGMYIV